MGAVALLARLDTLPEGFVDTPAEAMHRLLPAPSLVRLPGQRDGALFVAVLQHGNERTGLEAIQRLLADYRGRPLPRPLWLFIGNPEAAREGRRRLAHQPDLNRCWPGTELSESPETRMTRAVIDTVRQDTLFASIDIHNTTGESPHYAGVNVLDDRCLHLAGLFARTVVYFTRPRGAQAQAMAGLCPAVTLECGRVGNAEGVAHAHDFLERCLHLETLPSEPPERPRIDLFHSVALVTVPHGIRFDFGTRLDDTTELALDPGIDRLNFRELPAGTSLGKVRNGCRPVHAVDPAGVEVTGRFFETGDGELRLRRAVMPSLLTRDARIVRQDCLCHLMERIPWSPEGA